MKITVQERMPPLPYSLHDACVTGLLVSGQRLVVDFQTGIIKTEAPYPQVQGSVEVDGIDWDFSAVYLLDYKDGLCGGAGRFTGEKMEFRAFAERFDRMNLTILDETYGYRMLKWTGLLSTRGGVREWMGELCYKGDLRYRAEE